MKTKKKRPTKSEIETADRAALMGQPVVMPRGGGIYRIKCGGGYRVMKRRASY